MKHAAPVTRLAVAYVAGVAVGSVGAPIWMAPLVVVAGLALPIPASARPGRASLVLVVGVAWLSASLGRPGACRDQTADGDRARLLGHFLAMPREGSAPFRRADGCGDVTVVVPDDAVEAALAGRPLTVAGSWRAGSFRPWFQAREVQPAVPAAMADGGPERIADGVSRALVRWRDELVGRLPRLYGDRAPLVAALVFARREGMDREIREAFTVSGIAHLLAISGFHVGVIAGLALALLRTAGASRRGRRLGAAAVAWAYVAFIGFPDAACRAALILGLVAASRSVGRPPTRWAALATAALTLLAVDPGKVGSAGFQLSFAGAAGLVAWARPLERFLLRTGRNRVPRGFASACAAGVAATVATLPIVAWHFERASAVGVPMTLVASPLVSLALPGALLTIVLDLVAPGPAAFFAGGVDVLLDVLVAMTSEVAGWPGVSVWTTRATVLAGVLGVALASWVARRPRIGAAGRRRLVVVYVVVGVVVWPVAVQLEGRGRLELYAIDVGQGDAIAVRSPGGRWMLVDAGPPGEGPSAAHPVVRALRARGVHRLETLVLTHPDADHFGGAGAVLESFEVGQVLDPLVAAPKRGYAELLVSAREEEIPWREAAVGLTWEVDGVRLTVLHPPENAKVDGSEANDASVVLLVAWREFEALLTGDAYTNVERAIMERVGDVDVLKVGHHGSETSTDPDFLATIRPELAVISVGRRNRYGHPAPVVLHRLEEAGVEVLRTDLQGGVRLLVGRDGVVDVRTDR